MPRTRMSPRPPVHWSMVGAVLNQHSVFTSEPHGHYYNKFAQPRLYANRKRGIMPTVRVRENEPFDVALRRFKRSCEKAGILTEIRRREFYEKPTSVRKRKAAAAVKRHAKRMQRDVLRRQRLY